LTKNLALLVLGTVALWSLSVWAQGTDPAEEAAKKHNQLAIEYVDQGRFTEAVEEFKKAYDANPKPSYLFNTARALEMIGRGREAVEHYERYAASVTSLDKRDEALALAAEARKRLATLTIAATPDSAMVEVDGDATLCKPGVGCLLDPKSYVVLVSGPGLVTETRKVDLKAGEVRTETVILTAVKTVLSVSASEHGARVYVDGTLAGAAPLTKEVAPGKHGVKVELEGFETQERDFEVEEGKSADLNFFLVKKAAPVTQEPITRKDVVWRSVAFPGMGQFYADYDGTGTVLVAAGSVSIAVAAAGMLLSYYYAAKREQAADNDFSSWTPYVTNTYYVGVGGAVAAGITWIFSGIHAATLTLPPAAPPTVNVAPMALPGGGGVTMSLDF